MPFLYALAVLVGSYLLGSFNTAYFLGKKKNVNILESGSGNPGASNAMATMGWGAAVIVGAVDIAKCALSVVITRIIFRSSPDLWFLAALGAIMGHMFPFYLKFKGGKGLACLVGALIALDWRAFIVGGLLIIVITLVTDYIFIATCLLAVLYPVFAYFFAGWNNGNEIACVVPAAFTGIIIFSKHIINIKRLIKGEEIGLRGAHSGKYRKNENKDQDENI